MSVVKPLTGHTSQDTAYLVGDYLYGQLRCKIRYWLESDPKKGFRFVSQTENPKTLRWNAPKKNTYSGLVGAMYLDEKGHCVWTGLHAGAKPETCLEFIASFPQADCTLLRDYVRYILLYSRHAASDKAHWFINGVKQENSPTMLEGYARDVELWGKVALELAIGKV